MLSNIDIVTNLKAGFLLYFKGDSNVSLYHVCYFDKSYISASPTYDAGFLIHLSCLCPQIVLENTNNEMFLGRSSSDNLGSIMPSLGT